MGSYALPTATVATAPSTTRSRSYQNLDSPNTTPTLDSSAFANGTSTPKAYQHTNGLGIDTSPAVISKSHARSSSYLAGLANKVPFRTNSVDDMRKGRPRGESDLGRPAMQPRSATAYDFSRPSSIAEEVASSSLPVELLTAILLPLPFLLSSLNSPLNISTRHVHTTKMDVAEDVLEEMAESAVPVPASILSLTETCALTAGTLLLVGLWGQLMLKRPSPKRRRSSLSTPKEQVRATGGGIRQTVRRVALRMASVALPYLATVEIGGVRTGVVLLTAVASGLVGDNNRASDHSFSSSIRHAVSGHRWTCLVFVLSLAYDLIWHVTGTEYSATFRGYLALAKSVLLLAPPLPNLSHGISSLNASKAISSSAPSTPFSPIRESTPPTNRSRTRPAISALISSPDDVRLTLIAGGLMAAVAIILALTSPLTQYFTSTMVTLYVLSIASAASAFVFTQPSFLQQSKIGLGVGLTMCQVFGLYFEYTTGPAAVALSAISSLAFLAASLDTSSMGLLSSSKGESHTHDHGHQKHHHHHHHHHPPKNCSRFTRFLLAHTGHQPLIHDILEDKESRRIVYFMFINLGFMFVQTFYALVSGSLGLLSDSIHMFFDCMGLLAGLIASIMSKWPPNARFPYGYGKVETLSGLGNGIFLMIISVEIIWESFERFMEGAELKRLGELMFVSVAGLGVNLIGLVFIGHAHHHGHSHGEDSHGGHSHSHSHSHENGHAHSHSQEHKHSHDHMMQQVASADSHGHSHGHSNDNMLGIYLHIMADTMGSVAVIISTALTYYTDWSGWDPLASCIIAILIIAASYPLVTGSARRLLLTVPYEVEYKVREALQEIGGVRGVSGYAVPRFWLEDGEAASHSHAHHHEHHEHHQANGDEKHSQHRHDHTHNHFESPVDSPDTPGSHCEESHGPKILGAIHIIASRGADTEDVRMRTADFLKERNIYCVIQVDKEGQARCWCGGDKSLHQRTSSVVPGLA